jgi:peptide deformylase
MRTERVTSFDAGLSLLIDDLLDTMEAKSSLGLSAPQVGDLRSVAVISPSEDSTTPRVFVNPEILSRAAWGLIQESCLSLPGVTGNVLRRTEIRVRAQYRNGDTFECDLSGMDAVSLQHEIDHLEGKLFIDRLSVFRRLGLRLRGGTQRMRDHAA